MFTNSFAHRIAFLFCFLLAGSNIAFGQSGNYPSPSDSTNYPPAERQAPAAAYQPPAYQPGAYTPQGYDTQAYQPGAYTPQGYEPQAYQPGGYQPVAGQPHRPATPTADALPSYDAARYNTAQNNTGQNNFGQNVQPGNGQNGNGQNGAVQPAAYQPNGSGNAPVYDPSAFNQSSGGGEEFSAETYMPELSPSGNSDPVTEAVYEETVPVEDHSWYWISPSKNPWSGAIEFGLSGTEGNSDTLNIRAGGKFTLEDDFVKHKWDVTHVDNSQDGIKTAINTFSDARFEWKFQKSPLTYYVHKTLEYDEFKAFDLRVSVDTGLGYRWIDNDIQKLTTRIGGGGSREIGGANNEWTPEIVAGIEWSYIISEGQRISASGDYFPSIEDFADYRFNAKIEYETVLSAAYGLSLKLSVIDRYDSTPGTAKPNDINYAALMLWAF